MSLLTQRLENLQHTVSALPFALIIANNRHGCWMVPCILVQRKPLVLSLLGIDVIAPSISCLIQKLYTIYSELYTLPDQEGQDRITG